MGCRLVHGSCDGPSMVNAASCGLDVSARFRQGVTDVAPQQTSYAVKTEFSAPLDTRFYAHEITKSHDAGVPDQGREAGAGPGGHPC
jgi:hypothetical protein